MSLYCARSHTTIRLAGLRWSIRAQLARRGGHNARPRIAPGSTDGYIQALRVANDGDLENPIAMATQWKTKAGAPVAAGIGRPRNPSIGKHPEDSADPDSTDLEKEMGELMYASKQWAYYYNKSTGVNWENAGRLAPEQRKVKDWMGARSSPISNTMGVHILNDVVGKNDAPNSSIVVETPTRIPQKGSPREKALADEDLVDMVSHSAGRSLISEMQRGGGGGPVGAASGKRSPSADCNSAPPITGAPYYWILMPDGGWGLLNERKRPGALYYNVSAELLSVTMGEKGLRSRAGIFFTASWIRKEEIRVARIAAAQVQPHTSIPRAAYPKSCARCAELWT